MNGIRLGTVKQRDIEYSLSTPSSDIASKEKKTMKFVFVFLGLTGFVSGHTIFQKVSVNGADQGQLKGVRAPSSDYPIQNVNDAEFACNKAIQFKDNTVISIPVGAKVGAWWGHVIGGAQSSNDPDDPIAPSHKGVCVRM